MADLHVIGMHGLGDNLHQRTIVRHLLAAGETVWLETPWPCVYHDLAGDRLNLVGGQSFLRTQNKNARRERTAFAAATAPRQAGRRPPLRIRYTPDSVRQAGSVLGGMLRDSGFADIDRDFRLPIPSSWRDQADAWRMRWGQPDKPLLIYRPLVERREWGGCAARNPDHEAYADLIQEIREAFFVVSVADLQPGAEWMVGYDIEPDVALHRGELSFEALAALTAQAALVVSSPGFAVILAQAVETPSVAVFGGYEDGRSFSAGARFAPHLAVEPMQPCCCFSHSHACRKAIDMPAALAAMKEFAHEALGRSANRI